MSNFKNIPINKIDAESLNRKVDTSSEEFINLKNSIIQLGVLQPIGLRAKGDGTFQIVWGGHRFNAVKQLFEETNDKKFETIAANIMDIEQKDVQIAQIVENLRRKRGTDKEYAEQLLRIIHQPEYTGLTRAEICAKIGITQSQAWINNILSLNDLIPEASELLDKGKINLSSAYQLATLPAENQIDFIDRAMSMKTGDFSIEIAKFKKELKAKKQGRQDEAKDPLADMRIRSKKELREAFIEAENKFNSPNLDAQSKAFCEGRLSGIAFCISLDQDTIAKKEAEAAADKAKRDEITRMRNERLKSLRQQINTELPMPPKN